MLVLFSLTFRSAGVFAASKTVSMKMWGFNSDTSGMATALAKKIGGMKQRKSRKYRTVYFTGKKVTIGVDNHALPWLYSDEYVRITNKGNKRFRIFGIKIGDSKAAVLRKMKKKRIGRSSFKTKNGGSTFSAGDSEYIIFKYRKGKVSKWIYIVAPSG